MKKSIAILSIVAISMAFAPMAFADGDCIGGPCPDVPEGECFGGPCPDVEFNTPDMNFAVDVGACANIGGDASLEIWNDDKYQAIKTEATLFGQTGAWRLMTEDLVQDPFSTVHGVISNELYIPIGNEGGGYNATVDLDLDSSSFVY
jgi:hypothetical protein